MVKFIYGKIMTEKRSLWKISEKVFCSVMILSDITGILLMTVYA